MKYKNKLRLVNLGKGVSLPAAIGGYSLGLANIIEDKVSRLLFEAETKAYSIINEAEVKANNILNQAENTTINVNVTENIDVNQTLDGLLDNLPIQNSISNNPYINEIYNGLDTLMDAWNSIPEDIKLPFTVAGLATASYFILSGESKRLTSNNYSEISSKDKKSDEQTKLKI